jgi:hypothetical protein
MSDQSVYHLDIVIDHLTNSIREVQTGKIHETEIYLATKADIKLATKKSKWHFPWSSEFVKKDRNVFKLILRDQPDILQGLISISDMGDHMYVYLAESAPINFGDEKLHEGVGGNLFSFACKASWDAGYDGIIAFKSKSKLLIHYQQVLGAVHIGHHNMIIYPESALTLIKQYFKK